MGNIPADGMDSKAMRSSVRLDPNGAWNWGTETGDSDRGGGYVDAVLGRAG